MMDYKSSDLQGTLLLFLAGIAWGTVGIFVMLLSYYGASSALTSFLRMFFAIFIMAGFAIYKHGLHSFIIDRRTLIFSILLGIICQGIYNLFYTSAITLTGVAISAVLLNTAPVFTALTAILCFAEKITFNKSIALIINIIGCILTVTGGQISMPDLSLIGIVCGVMAGFCYGITAIICKFAAAKSNTFVISTYSYISASLTLLFFLTPSDFACMNSLPLLAIGFCYALIPTAIGYMLYYEGLLKIREISKAPVIASIETVLSAFIGVLIYHEALGAANFCGIIMVLFSILLMNRK